MKEQHLSEQELAARFGVTPRTIQSWRRYGVGPKHIIIGKNTVRYRLEDVIEYEHQRAQI